MNFEPRVNSLGCIENCPDIGVFPQEPCEKPNYNWAVLPYRCDRCPKYECVEVQSEKGDGLGKLDKQFMAHRLPLLLGLVFVCALVLGFGLFIIIRNRKRMRYQNRGIIQEKLNGVYRERDDQSHLYKNGFAEEYDAESSDKGSRYYSTASQASTMYYIHDSEEGIDDSITQFVKVPLDNLKKNKKTQIFTGVDIQIQQQMPIQYKQLESGKLINLNEPGAVQGVATGSSSNAGSNSGNARSAVPFSLYGIPMQIQHYIKFDKLQRGKDVESIYQENDNEDNWSNTNDDKRDELTTAEKGAIVMALPEQPQLVKIVKKDR